jgi:hypothetical protein
VKTKIENKNMAIMLLPSRVRQHMPFVMIDEALVDPSGWNTVFGNK